MHTHSRTASAQAGSITVVAVFFSLMIAGLCVAMVEMGVASRRTQSRQDSNLYALEAAEAGTVFAEQEVHAQTDPGGDGIGTMQGSYAGGRFTVTATKDPADPLRYTLAAQGTHGPISRRIETCVQLLPGSAWEFGVYSRNSMTWGSNGAQTDAYDSRLGTYASQATNKDAAGWYALPGGTVGSNGTIDLKSAVTIRGNAMAGPGQTVGMSTNATVTGSTAPLSEEIDLPPTPYAEFLAAATTNDNGVWTTTGPLSTKGKAANWIPATKVLQLDSGNTLTLTGKTYFFSKLTVAGNATIKITNGPVKIYVTDVVSLSGGAVTNVTNQPINMQIYQYPYALPLGYTPTTNTSSISGGAASSYVVYAPGTPVTMTGNSGMCGAVICQDFKTTGAGLFHFDLALKDQMMGGPGRLHRLYWRDVNPPAR